MTTVGTGSAGIGGGDGGERGVLPGRGDERRGRGAGADREDGRVEDGRVEDGRVEAETARGREGRRRRGRRRRGRPELERGCGGGSGLDLSKFRMEEAARGQAHM